MYRLRPATPGDIEPATTLLNACHRHLHGRDGWNAAEVRAVWSGPGHSLARDVVVAVAEDGALVGTARGSSDPPFHEPEFRGHVDPARRGLGIGSSLADWAEGWARERIALAPADRACQLLTVVPGADAAGLRLFERRGYQFRRRFLRLRTDWPDPPPFPALPSGMEIVPFDVERDRAELYEAVLETFEDHYGETAETFERWWHMWTTSQGYDPALFVIARDGGELAGFSLCLAWATDDPAAGVVGDLGVRRRWRRRGLGEALLRRSFAELAARGRSAAVLYVDSESETGAPRLYARAGMIEERDLIQLGKPIRPAMSS